MRKIRPRECGLMMPVSAMCNSDLFEFEFPSGEGQRSVLCEKLKAMISCGDRKHGGNKCTCPY